MNDNNIEFFFGPVSSTDDNDDTYFADAHGNLYFYKIIVEDDMFYVHDTCSRMIPVDREFVRSMGTAMFGVAEVYAADNAAVKLFETRLAKTMELVDFFNNEQAL